jgi:hypothetical protein
MEALAILLPLILLAVLSLLFGVDSRITDERDHRTWWPGTRQ